MNFGEGQRLHSLLILRHSTSQLHVDLAQKYRLEAQKDVAGRIPFDSPYFGELFPVGSWRKSRINTQNNSKCSRTDASPFTFPSGGVRQFENLPCDEYRGSRTFEQLWQT